MTDAIADHAKALKCTRLYGLGDCVRVRLREYGQTQSTVLTLFLGLLLYFWLFCIFHGVQLSLCLYFLWLPFGEINK